MQYFPAMFNAGNTVHEFTIKKKNIWTVITVRFV